MCCPKSRGPSLKIIEINPMNKETKISPVESLLDKYSPKHGSHLPDLGYSDSYVDFFVDVCERT
jgi:hypothetical protein